MARSATLRIVAELADGWNVPFVSPDDFAHKREVLHSTLLALSVGTRPRSAAR